MEKLLQKSKLVVRSVLVLIFLFTVYVAARNLLSRETGVSLFYDTDLRLPSFTICPFNVTDGRYPIIEKGRNKTMQDLMTLVPSLKDSFIKVLLIKEKDFSYK